MTLLKKFECYKCGKITKDGNFGLGDYSCKECRKIHKRGQYVTGFNGVMVEYTTNEKTALKYAKDRRGKVIKYDWDLMFRKGDREQGPKESEIQIFPKEKQMRFKF